MLRTSNKHYICQFKTPCTSFHCVNYDSKCTNNPVDNQEVNECSNFRDYCIPQSRALPDLVQTQWPSLTVIWEP
jgi:hypothetical protein